MGQVAANLNAGCFDQLAGSDAAPCGIARHAMSAMYLQGIDVAHPLPCALIKLIQVADGGQLQAAFKVALNDVMEAFHLPLGARVVYTIDLQAHT